MWSKVPSSRQIFSKNSETKGQIHVYFIRDMSIRNMRLKLGNN